MLSFFNDAFKEEFFIGEHWVVIHEMCGNSFLTQLAKLFQDVPLWLLLPSEDLIVYPFTLFPRIAITNLFDKLIDSKLSCIWKRVVDISIFPLFLQVILDHNLSFIVKEQIAIILNKYNQTYWMKLRQNA